MAYFARSRAGIDMSAVEPNRIAGGAEHYDVIDTLAHGSTADLLLAVRRGAMGVDSLVVLKRLRTSPADDARSIDVFLQEARVSVRLRHANIVHTFSVGEDYGAPFLVMEFLEGESLREVMRECFAREIRFPPALAVHVAVETLKGLQHAHSLVDYDGQQLAFVHRDVSPHNIFVTYDGTTKLIDFGTAKTTLATEKTAEGVVKGKVAYLSPEQALGRELDPRTDLFSLGVTLWELLAGRRLMVGSSAFDTMLRILNTPAPLLSHVMEDVSRPLEATVSRALQRELDKRWQSAEEMRAALRDPALAASLGGPRAGSEELAEWMDYLFREQRAKKKRAIAAKMRELEHAGPRVSIPGPPLRAVVAPPISDRDVSMRFREDVSISTGRGSDASGLSGRMSDEPSLRFVGPSPSLLGAPPVITPEPPPRPTLQDSSIPPPEESGERLSVPFTEPAPIDRLPVTASAAPTPEPVTLVRASPPRLRAAESMMPLAPLIADSDPAPAFEAYAAAAVARASVVDPMAAADLEPRRRDETSPRRAQARRGGRVGMVGWLLADLALIATLGYLAGNPTARARAMSPATWRALSTEVVTRTTELVIRVMR